MYKFWSEKKLLNYLLLPFSYIYELITLIKERFSTTKSVAAKVICVGNIVAGGGGKTPVVQMLAKRCIKDKKSVAIILRGYKGRLSSSNNVVKVDANTHTAKDVGEEALMHSMVAPTFICADRYKSAKVAESQGAEIIIMDDGLQNYTLKKDWIVLVFDNDYFIGNGFLLPAGPLRSRFDLDFNNADQVYFINYQQNLKERLFHKQKKVEILNASLKGVDSLAGKDAVMFCALANPQKFLFSLSKQRVNVVEKIIFADHHNFSKEEIESAITAAQEKDCKLVTTSKDMIKIPVKYHEFFIEAKLEIEEL